MENEIKYEGVILINSIDIPCYVLKDGTRILSTSGFQRAVGITDNEPNQRSSGRLSEILNSKALSPYLSDDKTPSKYTPIIAFKGNQKIAGYNATILPDFCEALLKARDAGVELGKRQQSVLRQADLIIRSLAKVGIIALVDEATGYQYDRERYELQTILQTFISEEILEWQKTFQLSFYKEIFRLWNIPFTPENIKRKPRFIGKLTSDLVYKNMPKGIFVLEKLKAKTPKSEAGNYRYRLHQSLTADTGREALKKVIYSIETLASISGNKEKFKRLVKEKYGQTSIPFDNIDDLDNPRKEIEKTEFSNQLKGLLNVPKPEKS